MTEVNFSNIFLVKFKIHDFIMKLSKSQHKSSWFKKIIAAFVVVVTIIDVVVIDVASSITLKVSNANLLTLMSNYSKITFSWNFFIEFWKFSAKYSIICMIVSKIAKKSIIITVTSNITLNDINEVILSNEIIVYNSKNETVKAFRNLINDYSELFIDIDFAKLSKKNWMCILLKTDWESRIFEKVKVYSLSVRIKFSLTSFLINCITLRSLIKSKTQHSLTILFSVSEKLLMMNEKDALS